MKQNIDQKIESNLIEPFAWSMPPHSLMLRHITANQSYTISAGEKAADMVNKNRRPEHVAGRQLFYIRTLYIRKQNIEQSIYRIQNRIQNTIYTQIQNAIHNKTGTVIWHEMYNHIQTQKRIKTDTGQNIEQNIYNIPLNRIWDLIQNITQNQIQNRVKNKLQNIRIQNMIQNNIQNRIQN